MSGVVKAAGGEIRQVEPRENVSYPEVVQKAIDGEASTLAAGGPLMTNEQQGIQQDEAKTLRRMLAQAEPGVESVIAANKQILQQPQLSPLKAYIGGERDIAALQKEAKAYNEAIPPRLWHLEQIGDPAQAVEDFRKDYVEFLSKLEVGQRFRAIEGFGREVLQFYQWMDSGKPDAFTPMASPEGQPARQLIDYTVTMPRSLWKPAQLKHRSDLEAYLKMVEQVAGFVQKYHTLCGDQASQIPRTIALKPDAEAVDITYKRPPSIGLNEPKLSKSGNELVIGMPFTLDPRRARLTFLPRKEASAEKLLEDFNTGEHLGIKPTDMMGKAKYILWQLVNPASDLRQASRPGLEGVLEKLKLRVDRMLSERREGAGGTLAESVSTAVADSVMPARVGGDGSEQRANDDMRQRLEAALGRVGEAQVRAALENVQRRLQDNPVSVVNEIYAATGGVALHAMSNKEMKINREFTNKFAMNWNFYFVDDHDISADFSMLAGRGATTGTRLAPIFDHDITHKIEVTEKFAGLFNFSVGNAKRVEVQAVAQVMDGLFARTSPKLALVTALSQEIPEIADALAALPPHAGG